MVNCQRMLFSIPGSNNKWTDSLESIRAAPDVIIEVKEISGPINRYKHISNHGSMSIQTARAKFGTCT